MSAIQHSARSFGSSCGVGRSIGVQGIVVAVVDGGGAFGRQFLDVGLGIGRAQIRLAFLQMFNLASCILRARETAVKTADLCTLDGDKQFIYEFDVVCRIMMKQTRDDSGIKRHGNGHENAM
jgi:hypothetical protein